MTAWVAKLDDWGQPAWIAVMVLGFVVFWPIGLGILGYMLWSGRMGCDQNSRGRLTRWGRRFGAKMDEAAERFGAGMGGFRTSGNAAFDEYRAATLRRLEEEEREFQSFLERLRAAKDRAEFDQFMADRKSRGDAGTGNGNGTGPSGSPMAA
ncbi:MAG: DUF2852 domain-containing protein [Hyphomicrobiaceae bacterium]|nr:DUF2852 domain-containing protein [Hyphomicrobiaceae bacterium]